MRTRDLGFILNEMLKMSSLIGNNNGAFHCKWEVGIVELVLNDFQSKHSRAWTLAANRCLKVKSVNFTAATAADLTVEGTWKKDRKSFIALFFQVKALLALASYVSCLFCVFLCCFPRWKKQHMLCFGFGAGLCCFFPAGSLNVTVYTACLFLLLFALVFWFNVSLLRCFFFFFRLQHGTLLVPTCSAGIWMAVWRMSVLGWIGFGNIFPTVVLPSLLSAPSR